MLLHYGLQFHFLIHSNLHEIGNWRVFWFYLGVPKDSNGSNLCLDPQLRSENELDYIVPVVISILNINLLMLISGIKYFIKSTINIQVQLRDETLWLITSPRRLYFTSFCLNLRKRALLSLSPCIFMLCPSILSQPVLLWLRKKGVSHR